MDRLEITHTTVIIVAILIFSIRHFNEQHTRAVILAGVTCKLIFGKCNGHWIGHSTWINFHWNGFELEQKKNHIDEGSTFQQQQQKNWPNFSKLPRILIDFYFAIASKYQL